VEQQEVRDAEAQLLHLLELREFTTALNTFRTFERKGVHRHFTNEAIYSGFIQPAVRMGKLDVMERMLQLMMQNRVTPSIEFWHSILKLLSSRKQFASCVSIYSMCEQILPNDKVIFSCLINAALESGAPETAISMLRHYQRCDLEPADFVTAFRTYVAAGKVDEAETLFRKLGTNMTPLMLNLALLACINGKQPERAMDLVSEAHRLEAKASLPGNQVRIVDAVSYNTVIKGFAAVGNVSRCFECLQAMQGHSLQPDDVTLTSLLDISLTVADKRPAVADRLVDLLIGRGGALDIGICNVFIKGLIRQDRLSKAVEVYEALKCRNGSHPSLVTYSIVIKALVDAHDLERALLVVEDMASTGDAPDEIIYTHLLEGCHLVGNSTLGEQMFTDMVAAGVKPSEYTLTAMLKMYGHCGMLQKAQKLLAGWKTAYGFKPSVIHYTCLMSGCLRNKQFDQAWSAFELMEQQGVTPDEMTVKTLMPAMVNSQKFDCVLHLVRQVLQQSEALMVPATILNRAIAQMSLVPSAEEVVQEMKRLMKSAGVAVVASAGPNKTVVARTSKPIASKGLSVATAGLRPAWQTATR